MTPPEVAKQWGVAVNKVLSFIASGELRAINLATNRRTRPRWFIDQDDLEMFERSRAATPTTPPARRKRQRPGKDFFPDLSGSSRPVNGEAAKLSGFNADWKAR